VVLKLLSVTVQYNPPITTSAMARGHL